jgi:type IV secretion system protein VirD4
MIHANEIKTAFANMMRLAACDPLWAIVALITFPLRYARSFVMGAVGYLLVVFTVYFGIDYLGRVILGSHRGDVIWHIGDWVVMAFAIVLLIRLLSVPLITHFGTVSDDTHGSARFAGRREIAAGQRPIVATKLRYYADPEFAGLFTASQI